MENTDKTNAASNSEFIKALGGADVPKALAAAVAAIYFDDNSDYKTALWDVVSALGGEEAAELLMNDPQAAYHKYAA